MNQTSPNTVTKILTFAAVLEIGTGLLLMMDPRLVIALLIGEPATEQAMLLGRLAGIALLSLGLACWPSGQSHSAAYRGMLSYNLLVALFLAYLGAVAHTGGRLLWPGVAVHAAMTLLLVWKAPRQPLMAP